MSKIRCAWAGETEIYQQYHDTVWGVPVHLSLMNAQQADHTLFEFLTLEGAQAGLNWLTILQRQDEYRRVFEEYNLEKLASYTEKDTARCLLDEGIIRNRLKVASVVKNAKAYLEIQSEFGSFAEFIWEYVDGSPLQNKWPTMDKVPGTTNMSEQLSKDLKKRGMSFVGPTIMYAYMQATGMVNDHTIDCFRHMEVCALGEGLFEGYSHPDTTRPRSRA